MLERIATRATERFSAACYTPATSGSLDRGELGGGQLAWLMVEILETTPPDDRTTERRHDLRHRYASVKIREGVPVTDLAAQLGRAKKSMTLDTY